MACLILSAHLVPGLGRTRDRVPHCAHKAPAPGRAAPSPSARQVERISLGASLLPGPRSGVPAPAARIGPSSGCPDRRGYCSRIPPPQTRPGLCLSRPVPHAPALPCSPAGAGAVPVCGTRPSRRGSSPGVAPHGAPSSGQGSAGPGAGSPPLAAPAPAPAAARQKGGVEGGKLPATPTPGAGAPAATARPPATECERLRSKPAPAAASEHAQCRRGRARATWPGAESCGGGPRTRPGLRTADVGLGEGGTSQCRGGGPGAKGQGGIKKKKKRCAEGNAKFQGL